MSFLRIDGSKIGDAKTLHAELAAAFGFPKSYGKNLDALVDCLSDLDNPKAKMTKVTVPAGQVLTLVIDDAGPLIEKAPALFRILVEATSFVNFRRMEEGKPGLIALAFAHD
jgi:RNAse (barnase) inhibitor barstar